MGLGIFEGHYDIGEYWEGKETGKGNYACTYYIGRLPNGKLTIFGKDWGNVMTVEAPGEFDTYKQARTFLTKTLRFKGRLRKVR